MAVVVEGSGVATQFSEVEMSRIKKLLLSVLLLLLLAAGGLYYYKDAAVRAGIIAGSDQVLGSDSTRLDSASIDLFGGGLALRGLKLNNPDGYRKPHFFQVDSVDVEVSLGSLLEDRIVVPRLDLDGVELVVESYVDEKGPHLNLLTIKRQLASSGTNQAGGDRDGSGKKFIIETLRVRDMKVTGVMTIPGAGSWPLDLAVPAFGIDGIGEKKNGVVLAELVVIILDAVIDKAIEMIESDGSERRKVLGDAKDVLKFFGGGLKQAGLDSALGKRLLDEAVRKGLGDLLGGKKKKKDKQDE